MDFKELKSKKPGELHTLLAHTRETLRELRFKDANKQLKNVQEIRTVRTTIARILTLLNKKTGDAPAAAGSAEPAEKTIN